LQNLGLTPDAVVRPLLCPWERYLMLFPTSGPSSLLDVVAQPDERHANKTASVLGEVRQTKSIEYNIWFKRSNRTKNSTNDIKIEVFANI